MALQNIGHSLPPQVEGQLRCFLLVQVGKLNWSIPNPPKDIKLKLAWWGESNKCCYLRPEVENDPHAAGKPHEKDINYPIRCGPKQFSSYLKDMGQLHLDVVYGNLNTKFAEVRIHDIDKLEPNNPLQKGYIVVCCVSPFHGKNVGKINLSFSFQTVSDMYNVSSTIIPTTDQKYSEKTKPKKSKSKKAKKATNENIKVSKHVLSNPSIHRQHPQTMSRPSNPVPDNDMDISFIVGPGPKPQIGDSKQGNLGKPDRFNENTEKDFGTDEEKLEFKLIEKKPDVEKDQVEENSDDGNRPEKKSSVKFTDRIQVYNIDNSDEIGTKDKVDSENEKFEEKRSPMPIIEQKDKLINSLISKGNVLRDKMTLSSVESQRNRLQYQKRKSVSPSNGLLAELLNNVSDEDSFEKFKQESRNNMEEKAVELLLGKNDSENVSCMLKKYDLSDSDDHDVSEAEDPLHDSSLLSDLFYTTSKKVESFDESSIVFSDVDESNLIPRKETSPGKRSKPGEENADKDHGIYHDISTVSSSPVESSADDSGVISQANVERSEEKLADTTIGVEKLTKLGRVKSFKVHIHNITFNEPSFARGSKYFVEGKVPVSVEEDTQYIHGELSRVVSRSVSDNVVYFERSILFPIQFNERMVNYWWDKNIEFNVFVKLGNDEKASKLGKAEIILKHVLLADSFMKFFEVSLHHYSNAQPIGVLKMSVSLATSAEKHIKTNDIITYDKPPYNPVKSNGRKKSNLELNNSVQKNYTHNDTTSQVIQADGNRFPTDQETPHEVLHGLIMVTDGKNIHSDHDNVCANYYIVVRVFWSKGELKSKICWNNLQPNFEFQQIIPVEMSGENIRRMESNWLIIEIWNKQTNQPKDKLVGMCKVSLNQFYTSLSDIRFAHALHQSAYPIISIDDHVTVTKIQSNNNKDGSLHVLLALGSHVQIMQLLQMKSLTKRSSQILRENEANTKTINGYIDHVDIHNKYVRLTSYTSACRMSHQEVVFDNCHHHSFNLPSNISLQDVIYRAYCNKSQGEYVEFILYKRSNGHEKQCLAKGEISLRKLFMSGLFTSGSSAYQKFHVDLTDTNERIGCLHIGIKYERTVLDDTAHAWKNKSCIQLSIHKMCGLKSAEKSLIRDMNKHSDLDYYVKYFFPFYKRFAGKSNLMRHTYSPCLSVHEKINLPIIFNHGTSLQKSLAEVLEEGKLVIQLFCVSSSRDNLEEILIGEVNIPTHHLLSHVTGYRRWLQLKKISQEFITSVIGGIEVELKFQNEADRDEIINVARGMRWYPNISVDLSDENWIATSVSKESEVTCSFRLTIERILLPKDTIDRLNDEYFDDVSNSTSMYVFARYKFFNRSPVYTKAGMLNMKRSGNVSCEISHTDEFALNATPSLAWFLREELFEIQFWLCCRDEGSADEREILIGSCYLDLSMFSINPSSTSHIVDYYELFKMGADEMVDSRARILFSLNQSHDDNYLKNRKLEIRESQYDSQYSKNPNVDYNADDYVARQTSDKKELNGRPVPIVRDFEEGTVTVTVQVEEALHVRKVLQRDEYIEPNLYVSYNLITPVYTHVCMSTTRPVWNFRCEEKIKTDVLQKKRNIEFKLWRCTGSEVDHVKDILVGVASVDTSPLFLGMYHLNGWYHIVDFNRQTVGQLKVGVLPQQLLSPSASSKYLKKMSFLEPVNLEYTSFQTYQPHDVESFETTSKIKLLDDLKKKLKDLDSLTKRLLDEPKVDSSKMADKIDVIETIKPNETTLKSNGVPNEIQSDKSEKDTVENKKPVIRDKAFVQVEVLNDSYNSTIDAPTLSEMHEPPSCSKEELNENVSGELEHSFDDILSNVTMSSSSSEDLSLQPVANDNHDKHERRSSVEGNSPLLTINQSSPRSRVSEYERQFSQDSDDVSSVECQSDNLSEASVNEKVDFIKSRDEMISHSNDDVISLVDDVHVSPRDDESIGAVGRMATSISHEAPGTLSEGGGAVYNRIMPNMERARNIPNFFMKPDELADSMKALRLAANFRHSLKSSTSSVDSSVTTPTLSEKVTVSNTERRKNHELQEQIRKTLPADENEMDRITNIFLSKAFLQKPP